jgi:hypothetical protein
MAARASTLAATAVSAKGRPMTTTSMRQATHRLRSLARTAVAAAVLVTGALAIPQPAGAGMAPDVVFIGVRGSGQAGPGTPGWTPTKADPLGLGPELASAYGRLLREVGKRRNVDAVSIPYAASHVNKLLTNRAEYFRGLNAGVRELTAELGRQAQQHPRARFVLAGYSQGAMVVHRVLHQLDDSRSGRQTLDRLDAALLVGDGDRVRNERSVLHFHGKAPGNQGVGLSFRAQSGSRDEKFDKRLGARVLQVCNAHDIVCDFPNASVAVHQSYVGNPALTAAVERTARTILLTPKAPAFVFIPATAGVPVRRQLTADVVGQLEWGVTPPSTMPAGLRLSSSGLISGTPRSTPAWNTDTHIRVRRTAGTVSSQWVGVTVTWNAANCFPAPGGGGQVCEPVS